MSDIKCPYCGTEQEVGHDDGYGYEEDETHKQQCTGCDKEFKFTTSIMYHYEAMCQDDDHDLSFCDSSYNGNIYIHTECSNCDYRKCERMA